MNLLHKYYANYRHPNGLIGLYLVKAMNSKRHQALAEWALKDLELKQDAHSLDIGCGGGANVARLLEMCPDGKASGMDFSKVALKVARKLNRRAIESRRCAIVGGTAKQVPFIKDTFDLVTAFETIYYWPMPETCLSEVMRVLKPGGKFLIANESDGQDPEGQKWAKRIGHMYVYTIDELKEALAEAGFVDIETRHDAEKHWICVTGHKAG